MTEITPLIIEICLHYYVSGAPFHPNRMNAPAVVEAHDLLVSKGILLHDNGMYEPNGGALGVYISALCAVPLPELKWVIPEK